MKIAFASLSIISASLISVLPAAAFGPDPFSAAANLAVSSNGQTILSVSFSVPASHYLYADLISAKSLNKEALTPADKPKPYRKHDPFSGEERDVYTNSVTINFIVPAALKQPSEFIVSYQGCSDQLCFFPVTTNVTFSAGGAGPNPDRINTLQPSPADNDWEKLMQGFRIAGKKEGYIRSGDFINFLDESSKSDNQTHDRIKDMFSKQGIWKWIAALLILLGGLGLNLTPCVLPMIPINIAIIGAGAGAGSKSRGFMLGATYGGAIALTYGLLGLFVVLTGSRFGALNASYLFNAVIAVIFLFLALAMFDIFTIDLSRFQQGSSPGNLKKGSILTSFFMGSVSALLAGACVAPVVVSVLLLSADLFTHGEIAGIFLPFLLGIGMGLPWPFMGAGLSFLPKPGQWMERVKHVFGILIIGFAIYYGHLSYRLYTDQRPENKHLIELAQQENIKNGWLVSLPEALALAEKTKKPVFIDFWASWCKNCLAMEEKTFKDPDVRKKLEGFIRVKFRAEQPNEPATRHIMEYFNCLGLPTYVILSPANQNNRQ